MSGLKGKLSACVGLGSAVLLLVSLASCQVFNDSCPVSTPEVWGKGLPVDMDIRREYVRQCEAPVGNFLADAIRHYDYGLDLGESSVLIGLINSGAIRDGVECGSATSSRERIPKGPITDQDIYQLIPFYDDTIVVVKMTGSQLKRVLERSVSSLNFSGTEGQQGHFLQISGKQGIKVEVDCSKPAQTLNGPGTEIATPGQRIVSMCLKSGDQCFEITPTASYYVATLDYLVGEDDGVANDGFIGFHYHEGDEPPPEVIQTYIPLIDVVHAWLVDYESTIEAEYPENASEILKTYPSVEGRLTYTSCDELAGICGTQ